MVQINPVTEKKFQLMNSINESIAKKNIIDIDDFIEKSEEIEDCLNSIKIHCENMEKKWQLSYRSANSIPQRIKRKLQYILFSDFISQQNEYNLEVNEAISNIARLQEIISNSIIEMEKKGE